MHQGIFCQRNQEYVCPCVTHYFSVARSFSRSFSFSRPRSPSKHARDLVPDSPLCTRLDVGGLGKDEARSLLRRCSGLDLQAALPPSADGVIKVCTLHACDTAEVVVVEDGGQWFRRQNQCRIDDPTHIFPFQFWHCRWPVWCRSRKFWALAITLNRATYCCVALHTIFGPGLACLLDARVSPPLVGVLSFYSGAFLVVYLFSPSMGRRRP